MWENCPSDVKAELMESPLKCGLGKSKEGLLGGNADPLAPPALLNQSLHFTKWALLQHPVGFAM